jgi:hypothetical protein
MVQIIDDLPKCATLAYPLLPVIELIQANNTPDRYRHFSAR